MKINEDLYIGDKNAQLKDAILSEYDTENVPCRIGTWRGKPIYRIVLNLGYLPSGTANNDDTRTYNFELPNFYGFLKCEWFAYSGSSRLVLPYVYPMVQYIDYWITLDTITNSSVTVIAKTNRSSWRLWGIVDYVATTEITA